MTTEIGTMTPEEEREWARLDQQRTACARPAPDIRPAAVRMLANNLRNNAYDVAARTMEDLLARVQELEAAQQPVAWAITVPDISEPVVWCRSESYANEILHKHPGGEIRRVYLDAPVAAQRRPTWDDLRALAVKYGAWVPGYGPFAAELLATYGAAPTAQPHWVTNWLNAMDAMNAVAAQAQADHFRDATEMVPSDEDILGCAGVSRQHGDTPAIFGTADIVSFAHCAPIAAQPQPSGNAGELPTLDERATHDQWYCREHNLPMDADTTQYDAAFHTYRGWKARAALAAQASDDDGRKQVFADAATEAQAERDAAREERDALRKERDALRAAVLAIDSLRGPFMSDDDIASVWKLVDSALAQHQGEKHGE